MRNVKFFGHISGFIFPALLFALGQDAAAGGSVSPNPQHSGHYGHKVAWTADVNGDNRREAAVGAPGEPVFGLANAGAVYLVDPTSHAVVHTLFAPEPQENGGFGKALSGSGGLAGDGRPHLAVGAPDEDETALGAWTDCGAVYLFGGPTGQDMMRRLSSPRRQEGGRFGLAATFIRDVTGDGVADIAVGAPGEDKIDYADRCGRVYVFCGATFALVHELDPPNPQTGALFGHALAEVPDVYGDGRPELLVGAPGMDYEDISNCGEAHLFNLATGGVTTFSSPARHTFGQFGYAVVGFSALDGAGPGDFAVGAPLESYQETAGAGLVHVYGFEAGTAPFHVHKFSFTSPNPEESGWFGHSLGELWDVNEDDKPDLIIGAPRESANDVPHCGRAYIIDLAAAQPLYVLDSVFPVTEGMFGVSVSCEAAEVNGDSGPDVVVGARAETVDNTLEAGRAYVFASPDYAVLEPEGSVEGEGTLEGEGVFEGEGEVEIPTQGRVSVEVTQVDDKAWVYLNETLIISAQWGVGENGEAIGHQPGRTGRVDITHLLQPGENELRFVVWNAAACCGVSGFFTVRIDNVILYTGGINTESSTEGVKFEDTTRFTWTDPAGEGGNPWASCVAACGNAGATPDLDGDGLSTCVENCLETDAGNVDTDGDGMPDGWEIIHGLEPWRDDAQEDPDWDAIGNLEEYLAKSHPNNPYSPTDTYYVSAPVTKQTATGHGTRFSPWGSIAQAIGSVVTSPGAPVRVVLDEGRYAENVALPPGWTLAGALGAFARIEGTITGAAGAALENLEIWAPSAGADVLLIMNNVTMSLRKVIFQGASSRVAVGIRVTGNVPLTSIIEQCTFSSLGTGIEIWGAIPVIRRCLFENPAVAGIALRGAEPVSGGLGDAADPYSGWNTFRIEAGTESRAVINDRQESVKMQNNDWGTTEAEAVDALIEGPAEYSPVLAVGNALIASSLFCTLWDRASNAPILNAAVHLSPSAYPPVTQNHNGVYAFPALPQNNYSVTATADAYQSNTQLVSMNAGQTVSLLVPMTPEAGEGQQDDFVLTITVEGQGVTAPVPGVHSYPAGAQVSITATPAEGWGFDHWEGGATGSDNPVIVGMTADLDVTAVFNRGGCGCSKSTPAGPEPGQLFIAALSMLIMICYGAHRRIAP